MVFAWGVGAVVEVVTFAGLAWDADAVGTNGGGLKSISGSSTTTVAATKGGLSCSWWNRAIYDYKAHEWVNELIYQNEWSLLVSGTPPDGDVSGVSETLSRPSSKTTNERRSWACQSSADQFRPTCLLTTFNCHDSCCNKDETFRQERWRWGQGCPTN